MTISIDAAPVDHDGRLLHAEDAAAQLCLCVERLIADAERQHLRLVEVTLHTTDDDHRLRDVLYEGLSSLATPLRVRTEAERGFHLPGMLVGLTGVAVRSTPEPDETEQGQFMLLTDELKAVLRAAGTVHFPGEPEFDAARTAWNLAAVQWPAGVAVPQSIDEVVAIVKAAASVGLRIAPQSTGHGAAALATQRLSDVLLVRLSELTGVTVDPSARTARVLGGTLWREVVAAAAGHGLAALHGSAGDVAVAGYVLGGGLSFYGRKFGLASASVRAIEMVTADGDHLFATAEENSELFWALRGGGGNFGVVVAIELDLIELSDVHAGMLLWDISRAAEVLAQWQRWTADAPESVTTSLRIMRFPAMPELPPFLSGRSLVVIDGAIIEPDEVAAQILAPLRSLTPEIDTFSRIPAAALLDVHMDPPGPVPAVSDHAMLDELTPDALDAFLSVVGEGVETPLMFAELRHLGGALARPDARAGALDHLPAAFALFAVAPAPTPALAEAGQAAATAVAEGLRPWAKDVAYLNFADRTVDVHTGYSPEIWAQLVRIRDRYDPRHALVANHPIR